MDLGDRSGGLLWCTSAVDWDRLSDGLWQSSVIMMAGGFNFCTSLVLSGFGAVADSTCRCCLLCGTGAANVFVVVCSGRRAGSCAVNQVGRQAACRRQWELVARSAA